MAKQVSDKQTSGVRGGDDEEAVLLLPPAENRSLLEDTRSFLEKAPAPGRAKLPEQAFPRGRASRIPLVALSFVLLLTALVTGWNILHYPRYEYGEGVSVSAAWAMFKQGRLSYYTYNYSQGPLGWFQIGAWTALTHGEKASGLYINSARLFMLVATTVSTWLLFRIVHQATGKTLAALGTALVFAASPLGVGLHRQVWVDNLATVWLLLSLYLLIIAPGRLDRVLLSAVAFGIALLTQKSFAVFLPGLCYFAWVQSHPIQRRFAGALWVTITISALSLFAVTAFLRGELFPSEVFSPLQKPHVSLIGTWFFPLPVGRGGTVLDPWGDFNTHWPQWFRSDPVLTLSGAVATGVGLLSRRLDPLLFQVSALSASFTLFLMINPTVSFSDVIPLTALLALSAGLLAAGVLKASIRVRLPVRFDPGVQASGALALLLLCFTWWAGTANKMNFTADATTPQRQAIYWVARHLPRQSKIVTDTYALADLSDPAFTSGHPFTLVNDGWASANDPSVRDSLLNNDWHSINFLVSSPASQQAIIPIYQPLVTKAWKHSAVIQSFGTGKEAVEVRQVTN